MQYPRLKTAVIQICTHAALKNLVLLNTFVELALNW